ncbi:hypothetical protein GHT06_008756 [Daphnia sinensis]|uniref:RRP15-like protein n=1 Tax=Daphnia sinensis TaxID=1820382 RepID=A0AAD5L4D2_9CRUS|nr:hypothetical protein GHT06_008756 [Daphnia sinensis]
MESIGKTVICNRVFYFIIFNRIFSIDCDDLLDSGEEYDDLESGQEASASDDGDSYTQENNSDSESNEKEAATSQDGKNVVYGNFGWADAMSKVLKSSKPKTKKSVILSKAKKDADIMKIISAQQEKSLSFEVEEAKNENVTKNEDPDVVRRKEWDLVGRVMPSITEDRERERILSKIATRGVVQLFNSVKIQQKTIQDKLREAGPLERKREKALKSLNKEDFYDLLKGGKRQEEATWSVLRDDFMPEVSMRDWDKQESSDSEDV